MKSKFALSAILSVIVLVILGYWMNRDTSSRPTETGGSLRFYCAAGISEPVQQIVNEYQERFGVQIETSYAGSGKLLTMLRGDQDGDLYLAADVSYMTDAKKFDLIEEVAPLAYQHPCVAKRKGDTRINSIEDLARDDVKISLADPKIAAISRVAKKMLAEKRLDGEPIWDVLFKNVTVERSTVNEVANDIKSGAVDAGIIWDATAKQKQYDGLEIVPVGEFLTSRKQIAIAVLRKSQEPRKALHFLRFMTSREYGNPQFKKYGYNVVVGDTWAETPELTLFTGGLMHPAIQASIDRFEEREGVKIVEVPNGCGILVAQIRTGEQPDAYFACDTTFMEMVSDVFKKSYDVSGTEMVLITKKGGQFESLSGIEDLATTDLRLGICNPSHSALGELSKRLLQGRNIWQSIVDRGIIVDQPSTADRLVESVVLGAMDAAIVYKANTTLQREKLNVIAIDDPAARAVQPIAVGANSKYPLLSGRLLDTIRSTESRSAFEDLGFEWLGD